MGIFTPRKLANSTNQGLFLEPPWRARFKRFPKYHCVSTAIWIVPGKGLSLTSKPASASVAQLSPLWVLSRSTASAICLPKHFTFLVIILLSAATQTYSSHSSLWLTPNIWVQLFVHHPLYYSPSPYISRLNIPKFLYFSPPLIGRPMFKKINKALLFLYILNRCGRYSTHICCEFIKNSRNKFSWL